MNRVVITGYGAIDALGKNSKEVEKKLFDGQCGLGKKGFGTTENTVEGTVGQVKDYETCDSWFEEHKIPYDRCAQFALHAAKEAVEMAGLLSELLLGECSADRNSTDSGLKKAWIRQMKTI